MAQIRFTIRNRKARDVKKTRSFRNRPREVSFPFGVPQGSTFDPVLFIADKNHFFTKSTYKKNSLEKVSNRSK